MESAELVFSVIDSLNEPVLLLQKNEENIWSYSYYNQLMGKLLDIKEENSKGDDKTFIVVPEGEIAELIKQYENEGLVESYTLHDLELFDAIYNVHFSKKDNYLLITFVEILPSELCDNIGFNEIGEECGSLVVVLDDKGDVVDINKYFLNILAMKKDNVLGKNFFQNYIPVNLDTLNGYFEKIMKDKSSHQHFFTPLKGDREEQYRIKWQVSKILRHEKTYVVAIGNDVSKFAEENVELKRQMKSIEVGFEHFPLAVGYMDAEGLFTKMNSRFIKMFRVEQERETIEFDKIPLFKKHIGFAKMQEHIKLIKEMSYTIDLNKGEKPVRLIVDISLLSGKKEKSKLYIVVARKWKKRVD
ncbi:PAS domain S-box protein [Sulfurimonas sp.]